MTNFKDEACYVIGGKGKDFITVDIIYRYNIAKDRWETGVSHLQVARHFAAACSLGNTIYTFAGVDNADKFLNSVEIISSNYSAVSELVELP